MPWEGINRQLHGLGFEEEAMLREEADTSLDANKSGFNEVLEEEAFNITQAEQLSRESLDWLAVMAMPTVAGALFPPGHLAVWDLITSWAHQKGKFPQIALGIPRGHGKTTVIKLFIIYCILFTEKKFILIVSNTAKNAENILADVEVMLNERNIIATFGQWDLACSMNRQDQKMFGFRGRNIVLAALGQGGSVRGINAGNERPDVIIMDDIQTKECADSEMQSAMLEEWMIGTLMKAKSPSGCLFIFAGNMFATDFSILKKIRKNNTWIKLISGAILADGTAYWPEVRSFESLIEELENDIAAGRPGIFFAEVMNDTEVGVNTSVDFSKIKSWKWNESVEKPQGKCIIIDPSVGVSLKGDPTSIGLFEFYDAEPGLRYLEEGKFSPKQTIKKALILAMRHGVKLIVVEAQSYQQTLLFWFEQIMGEYGITGIQCLPIHNNMTSKNARIATMIKALTNGELYLHPTVRSQVLHQIQQWKPMRRDNNDGILDLLCFVSKVQSDYEAFLSTDEDDMINEDFKDTVTEGAYAF